jgi:hypothetical protein
MTRADSAWINGDISKATSRLGSVVESDTGGSEETPHTVFLKKRQIAAEEQIIIAKPIPEIDVMPNCCWRSVVFTRSDIIIVRAELIKTNPKVLNIRTMLINLILLIIDLAIHRYEPLLCKNISANIRSRFFMNT